MKPIQCNQNTFAWKIIIIKSDTSQVLTTTNVSWWFWCWERQSCHPSHFFCSLFWEDLDISELYLRRQFWHLVLVTSTSPKKLSENIGKTFSVIMPPFTSRGWAYLRKFLYFYCLKLSMHPKHRKNCECCPGHHLIVNHYSSI